MMRLRMLFLALCLLWAAVAIGADNLKPDFLVRSWRNEEGLPHSIITCIHQSHDGYIWLGTYVGLVRFDGKRFVQYSSSNVPELEAGRIANLFEDRDDTLWVTLESGRLLAWKEGRVRVLLPGGSTNQPVIAMAQQTNGCMWLQNAGGVLARIKGDRVETVWADKSANRRNLGLVVDAEDQLWVGTTKGPQVWQGDKLNPSGVPELNSPVDAMVPARDGAVWFFAKRRLWKLKGHEVAARIDAPERLTGVAGMIEASDGRLWLGSSEGSLFCLKPGSGWTEITNSVFQGLNRLLYEDREGNIWRGGFGGGLTRIRPRTFTVHEFPDNGLDRYARAVSSDSKGNIWAILNDSIVSRISSSSKAPEAVPTPNIPQTVKSLFVDHQDSVWIGMDGGVLYRLRNGSLNRELNLGDGVETVNALFEDSRSNLWIGFTGGAGLVMLPNGDPARRRVIKEMPYPDVRAIAESPNGTMWFGTHYGGAFYLRDGKWTRLTTRDGLPLDYVRCFLSDPDGTMWIGTLRGLARWRNGKVVAIKSEQGLWNDSISHIADDGAGNLWISSFGGIYRVKREELNEFADGLRRSIQCVGYDRTDGLPSVECPGGFQPAGATSPDGRLWFPTASGLVSVAPNCLPENRLAPPVWIETIDVDGETHPITHSATLLEVGPGKRRFDFKFTALSYSAPEKVFFRHKLDGLDADWSRPDSLREVAYPYVPPGRYSFQVSACNNDGVWNPNGQTLALIVHPYFWQTWWFKIAIALLLAIALAWVVRLREQWKARLRLERIETEHAVERERSRIARDIHDDLGANLTQIAFLGQRVEGASHEPAEVERWIRKIPAAASRTIQSLDEIVWAINPKHDSLESLANYLSRFAQEFLTLAGIRCRLDVPMVLPRITLNAELRHNLVLAAREALQNIAAHAAATEVNVALQLNDTSLIITIADNGSGFDPTRIVGDGNGLPNMRRRLEDIGGTLDIVSMPGKGATVKFSVPQNRLHGRVVGKKSAPS